LRQREKMKRTPRNNFCLSNLGIHLSTIWNLLQAHPNPPFKKKLIQKVKNQNKHSKLEIILLYILLLGFNVFYKSINFKNCLLLCDPKYGNQVHMLSLKIQYVTYWKPSPLSFTLYWKFDTLQKTKTKSGANIISLLHQKKTLSSKNEGPSSLRV
jgi:hypothetical protein